MSNLCLLSFQLTESQKYPYQLQKNIEMPLLHRIFILRLNLNSTSALEEEQKQL